MSESILNLAVSKSPVGWKIVHTILTINRVMEGLQFSDYSRYKWRLIVVILIVFALKLFRDEG